jgi:hypothetical protein
MGMQPFLYGLLDDEFNVTDILEKLPAKKRRRSRIPQKWVKWRSLLSPIVVAPCALRLLSRLVLVERPWESNQRLSEAVAHL